MVCPSCKTETGSDSQFCPHCGANTTTGVAAAVGAQQGGLSETAAGVVAYITIVPAIIFLVMEPYNRSSFIRFHAWQSIFFVNVPIGIAAFVGGILYLEENRSIHAKKLDLLGVILLSLTLGCLVYPLIEGRQAGWPAWMLGRSSASW